VVAAPASPAAAAAVVASAASSAPLSTAVTESASLALSAAPSSSAPLPFGSFLSTVRRSGLRVLRTLDAPTLLRFAEQSLVLEEEVATGCLMIQGIALLEHFHRANGVSPLDWPEQATRMGQLVECEADAIVGGDTRPTAPPDLLSCASLQRVSTVSFCQSATSTGSAVRGWRRRHRMRWREFGLDPHWPRRDLQLLQRRQGQW